MQHKLTVLLLFLCFAVLVSAQDLPGKPDSLYSTVLKEKRKFRVILPDQYKPGDSSIYEVLYVLDGDWNTKLVNDTRAFLEENNFMPHVITVSILNTDRDRDFTPRQQASLPVSGGAPRFLAFLKDELMPYISKHYPIKDTRTFFGHSFGGLFGLYTLLTEPKLFSSYILADPAFSFTQSYIDSLAKARLPAVPEGTSLYMTSREGIDGRRMGIDSITDILGHHATAHLHWLSVSYPYETHSTVRIKSIFDGLKFSYSGYDSRIIHINPEAGRVLKDVPFTLICYNQPPGYVHYTKDGTQPVYTSPALQEKTEFSFSKNEVLKLESYYNRPEYNNVASATFTIGTTLPATARLPALIPGGLHFSYAEENETKPSKAGVLSRFFDPVQFVENKTFTCLVEGYIEIKKAGYYTFVLQGKEGSKLELGGLQLISPGNPVGNTHYQSYMAPLEKGFYPVRLEYIHQKSDKPTFLSWFQPGEESDNKLPPGQLFHQ